MIHSNCDWSSRWNFFKLQSPWSIKQADKNLINFLQNNRVFKNALDIGCGLGNDSIWLAEQGIEVTGIDLSSFAIEYAKSQLNNPNKKISFLLGNFLEYNFKNKFELIYDRGCFHGLDKNHERKNFVEKINNLLEPDGVWFTIIGSTENNIDKNGPPKHNLTQVVTLLEKTFQIQSVLLSSIEDASKNKFPAWIVVLSKKLSSNTCSFEY